MAQILCPHCFGALTTEPSRLVCPQGHSFDLARQGYVNLLPVNQKHSLHPGDTKEQVAARREFLDGGFYAPIGQAVARAAEEFCRADSEILDVGCGEGYYSAQVWKALPQSHLYGLDISKDAVRLAAGRHKGAFWLCGTGAKLPFGQEFDLLLSLFALTVPEEFSRVLKPGGIFIQALAAQDHLMGLKSVIYPEILLKEKDSVPVLEGFELLDSRPVRFAFTVRQRQIQNLLSMTPHFWRINKEGAKRLEDLEELRDTASVVVNIYQKRQENSGLPASPQGSLV